MAGEFTGRQEGGAPKPSVGLWGQRSGLRASGSREEVAPEGGRGLRGSCGSACRGWAALARCDGSGWGKQEQESAGGKSREDATPTAPPTHVTSRFVTPLAHQGTPSKLLRNINRNVV